MQANHKRRRGFTLIELMIAVAVLGIIAAIAIPNYQAYVADGRRTDGQAALMDAAQRLERCYSGSMAYDGGACSDVESDIDGSDSSEGYYTLSTDDMSATTYTIEAAPQRAQSEDECATLTLDHTGSKGIDGADAGVTAEDCW